MTLAHSLMEVSLKWCVCMLLSSKKKPHLMCVKLKMYPKPVQRSLYYSIGKVYPLFIPIFETTLIAEVFGLMEAFVFQDREPVNL